VLGAKRSLPCLRRGGAGTQCPGRP
jgi:hypothetical protein